MVRVRRTGNGVVRNAALLCALLESAAAVAQEPPPSAPASPSSEVATVGIVVLHRVDVATSGAESVAVPVVTVGAGAVVSPEGVVATARELVEGAAFIGLHVSGRGDLVPATRVFRAQDDLALLVPASSGGTSFDRAGAAEEARPVAGQLVSVGSFPASSPSPTTTDATVLRGMVYGLVELSVALDAASFGGPVVDAGGRLLGIVVLRHQDDPAIVYALPASTIADAVDRAAADGSLAVATAGATGAGAAPYLPAAAIDPRWVQVGDAAPAAGSSCAAGVSAELSAALSGAPPGEDAPVNGHAALLYGALAWNLALCDLQRIGLGVEFLLRRETVGAWLAQGNPTLDRLSGAAAIVRRAAEADPAAFASSPFAAVLLRFGTDLEARLAEVRAGLPGVPPPVPIEPPPPGPGPIAPLPIEPVPGGPLPPGEYEFTEPDPTRAIWSPTAFLTEEGMANLRSTGLGMWELGYTVTPNVMIHGAASIPVMNVGLLPGARFAVELSEYVRLGLDTHLGFWLYYPDVEIVVLLYGGGPALTVGTRDAFFNLSLLVYGVTVFDRHFEGDSWDDDSFVFLSPNLGGSLRVSRLVKLNLELHAPALLNGGGDEYWDYGEVWALAYGVRIFGQHIYGDVSFVVPIFPGATDLLQFMPIGLPMLNFGVQW